MSGSRPPWAGVEDEGSVTVSDHLRQEYAARGEPSATLRVASDSVEAYLEYERVVGGADGGVLFSEEEYDAFRRTALERSQRRLYVTWRNGSGMDCKAVGPATLCECGHRYKEHRTQNNQEEITCRDGCSCASYQYLPSAGAWHAKCGCKHGAVRDRALPRSVCVLTGTDWTLTCAVGAARCRHQGMHSVCLRPLPRHLQLRVWPAVGSACDGRGDAAAAHGGGAPCGQPGRRRGRVCGAGWHHRLQQPDGWCAGWSGLDGWTAYRSPAASTLTPCTRYHQATRRCSGAR
jgi:hypothetical protein